MQHPTMELGDYNFQPDLSIASTTPARWYTDPAILEAERHRVFSRSWQPAGLAAWAPAPAPCSPATLPANPCW